MSLWLFICVSIERMFTLFLLGNIASGKSYAARYLERAGGLRIDLDQMAKDLYQPGSAMVAELADCFGWDILDETGGIVTARLASRAFADPEQTARLNEIVHPVLVKRLADRLLPYGCCVASQPNVPFAVVEVSAPSSFADAFSLADEVATVWAPFDVRRERAVERGMSPEDFERRAALQPSDEQLNEWSSVVFDNAVADGRLEAALDAWIASHGFNRAGEAHD